MNLDDESLLTAYLDGEIDAERRLQVESALRSSPELAEQLLRLSAVRDLVSGLTRPATAIDLSAAFDRLEIRRRPALLAFPHLTALGFGLGAAAVVLLALTLGPRRAPRRGPVAPRDGRLIARTTRPATPPAPVRAGSSPATAAPGMPTPERQPELARANAPRVDVAAVAEEAGPSPEREQERIRALLDSPDLRRVFVVTDVMGGDAGERVNRLVQQTPRSEPSYGQITISQGIVIDPKHPDEATVFALALTEEELAKFQAKLDEEFGEDVESAPPDPVIVAQLSEIGQVAVLNGPTTADVVIPEAPSRVALRDAVAKDRPAPLSEKAPIFVDPADLNSSDPFARARVAAMLHGPTIVRENPTPEQEQSGRTTHPARRASDATPPPAAPEGEEPPAPRDARPAPAPARPRPDRPAIVLVWVTRGR